MFTKNQVSRLTNNVASGVKNGQFGTKQLGGLFSHHFESPMKSYEAILLSNYILTECLLYLSSFVRLTMMVLSVLVFISRCQIVVAPFFSFKDK